MFWKWIPKEDWMNRTGRKPRTLRRGVTPIGARFIDRRLPTETVQMIGDPGTVVPNVSVDLGVADIFVKDNAQTIIYTGGGEQTNVGIGVDSPTMGMTIGGAEPKGAYYSKQVYPRRSISRTADSKELPPRTASAELQGINRPQIAEDTEAMLEGTYEEPVTVKPEPDKDDFSDLVSISDDAMDEIFGTGERKRKRKPVSRIRYSKKLPRRGRDNSGGIIGLRRY